MSQSELSKMHCVKKGEERFKIHENDLRLFYDFLDLNEIPVQRAMTIALNFLMVVGKVNFASKEEFIQTLESFVRKVKENWDKL